MLHYKQLTGILSDSDGVEWGRGYSGIGNGKNNPDAQATPNYGPIPCGVWLVGAPFDSPNTGPFTLPLTPAPGTDALNRDDFRIHGDSILHPGSASHGCIILPHDVRVRINAELDRTLSVS